MTAKISIRDVDVVFKGRGGSEPLVAARNISLDVPEGAFISLLGPSGCGKSTLLNVVSGMMPPSAGQVLVDGRPVDGVRTDIGYMLARDGLMPWRNAVKNVGLGLELRSVPDRDQIATDLIERVGLKGFENHYRHELSHGMRQRVAVARTFATDPDILLMDEPFGALDAQTRVMLQDIFLQMWETKKKTVLFVTHDLMEAIVMSDQVVVMTHRPGEIKAIVDIDLPRPRSAADLRMDPRFQAFYKRLWDELKDEVQLV